MKNLRNLLVAMAIFALLPFANVAHAQVVVYNHGKRVRVAHTASKTWSNVKSGVTTESRRIGHATTQGWNGLKRGVSNGYRSSSSTTRRFGTAATRGWNGLKHGVSNGYSSTTMTTQPGIRYGTSYRTTIHQRSLSMNLRTREAQNRARLYRERLTKERLAREHRISTYNARIARQR